MAHQARAAGSGHHRCSACGAPAQWDPGVGALKCTFCGGTTTVEVPEEELVEHAIAEAADRLALPQEAVSGAHCDGCGATVTFEEEGLIAGTCPFCGDHAFVRFTGEGARIPPTAVLPFTVPKETAVEGYEKWLKELWFRPDSLKSHARLEEMHGVYLPFWSWRANVVTSWRADVGREHRGADGHTHTTWTTERDRREHFVEGVLVYASKGLPEDLVREIEPFDLRYVQPYDRRFLSGFAAESYFIDPLESWVFGEARIREEERKRALLQVPGDTYKNFVHRTNITSPTFQHLLLPVWVSAYRYQGRSYRFLVNGRTGEVQGTAPWSWLKIAFALLALLAFLGGIGWFMYYNGTADERAASARSEVLHADPNAPDPSPLTPLGPPRPTPTR